MNRIIKVKIIPRAKKERVVRTGKDEFKVYVNAPPIDNKANQALIKSVAFYFDIKKSSVRIIKGEKARKKLIKINF